MGNESVGEVGGDVTQHGAAPTGVNRDGGGPTRVSVPLVTVILVAIAAVGLAPLSFVEWFPEGPPPAQVELGPVVVGSLDAPALGEAIGEWSADGETFAVVAVTPLGFPAQLVADLGSADGWLAVRAPTVSGGWGVVFRQRSAGDYLWVLAAPAYSALKVGRTDAGVPTDLGAVSPVPVRDGMTLTVGFVGDQIRLLVDGREVGRFTDVGAPPGTGVGLLGAQNAVGLGQWSDFRAGLIASGPANGPEGVGVGG